MNKDEDREIYIEASVKDPFTGRYGFEMLPGVHGTADYEQSNLAHRKIFEGVVAGVTIENADHYIKCFM